MSTLKVSSIRDLSGSGGLNLSSGSITVNGTLTVSNIVINGTIGGSSSQVIPSISGQSGKYLSTNGTSMSWATVQTGGGPKSISVYNSNSTWNKPTGIKRIWVMCTAGGGGDSQPSCARSLPQSCGREKALLLPRRRSQHAVDPRKLRM